MRQKKRANSYWLWRGPSPMDEKPVILIASNVNLPSTNTKTGWMVQLWIMREDIPPNTAVWEEEDASVCGGCPLRLNRFGKKGEKKGCYVNVSRAPNMVYKSYKNGNIPYMNPAEFVNTYDRPLRQGAYGDPAMIPFEIWEILEGNTNRIGTSYTHQYDEPWFDSRMWEYAMGSVETLEQKQRVNAMGGRTYRIIDDISDIQPDELVCPNKTSNVQCADCGLCSGTRKGAKNIVIQRIG